MYNKNKHNSQNKKQTEVKSLQKEVSTLASSLAIIIL